MSKKLICVTHEHKHGVDVHHAYIDDSKEWYTEDMVKALDIDYDAEDISENLDWDYVNHITDLTGDDSDAPRELSEEAKELIDLIGEIEASEELTETFRGRYGTDFDLMRTFAVSGMMKKSAINFIKRITKKKG